MPDQAARDYILKHDQRVKQLNRKPVPTLRDIYRQAQEAAGMLQIAGGPVSKDEFISAILELEFPEISAQRAAYYASVS